MQIMQAQYTVKPTDLGEHRTKTSLQTHTNTNKILRRDQSSLFSFPVCTMETNFKFVEMSNENNGTIGGLYGSVDGSVHPHITSQVNNKNYSIR